MKKIIIPAFLLLIFGLVPGQTPPGSPMPTIAEPLLSPVNSDTMDRKPADRAADSTVLKSAVVAADSTAPLADSAATRPAPDTKPEKKTVVRNKNKDEETEVITTYKGSVNELRSPKKAFFLSFILPGLGEYYARAGWVRVSVPAAIELASYISIYMIRQKYNALADTFRVFADNHFNYDKFVAFYNYIHYSPDSVVLWERDVFSHSPDSIVKGDNNYYEMIAKYDEFAQGWDDVTPDMVKPDPDSFHYIKNQAFGSSQDWRYRGFAIQSLVIDNGTVVDTTWLYYHDGTPKRPRYFGYSANQLKMMDLRDQANSMGDKVMWVFYTMLINRIASAVDAVLAANAFNRRITGNTTTQLERFHVVPIKVGQTALLTNGAAVTYRF